MTTPPAGWYADPYTPGSQRYWDGTQWTHEAAPMVAAAPALSLDEQRRAVVAAKRWPPTIAGWLGVAALVTWLVPGGVAGMVVGALAVGAGAGVLFNARYGGRGVVRGIFAVVAGIATLAVATMALTSLVG